MMASLFILGVFVGIGLVFGDSPLGIIVMAIIAVGCGVKCIEWAHKIKKSPTIGFLVGFWAGLVGLVGYWIYYKIKS